MNENIKERILGLDIGTNSLGWALMTKGKIIVTGSRIFQAGMEGDIEKGRDKSRNVQRRDARHARRGLERHTRRLFRLAKMLQRTGLLPDGDLETSEDRHELFFDLDHELNKANNMPHALPYFLRNKALNEKLTLHELGRIFYHLCQRRGFKSNKKESPKSKEEKKELGQVKGDIKTLSQEIKDSKSRTLGEYLSKLDHGTRIRKRYTAREMYEEEFNQIWENQAKFYPDILTDELKKKIHHPIFHQRINKIKKNSIGFCTYEKEKRRIPKMMLEAQRFRMIGQINNTKIIEDKIERLLTNEEREILIEKLETVGKLKFNDAKKELGLKVRKTEFNWQRGPKKQFDGDKTSEALIGIFGKEKWEKFKIEKATNNHGKELDITKAEQLVEDIRSIDKPETLINRGKGKWGLTQNKAEEFAQVKLEQDYLNVSRTAIKKLLPEMEKGKSEAEVVWDIYGDIKTVEKKDFLPPLLDVVQYINNPTVIRALTELRKVVNTIIREYGKPDKIHIEFVRELKQSKANRENTSKNISKNETARKKTHVILKNIGITDPSRTDELKILLWEECRETCPYTGITINVGDLFGDQPKYDIEHIIPYSRSLDDSFLNKTLCLAEENREVKKDRTPFEAYRHSDKWEEIKACVTNFNSDVAGLKLKRFMMNQEEGKKFFEDFTARHLNDTSYTAKLSQEYLSVLYGKKWREHITASNGRVTQYLRNSWKLNKILQDGGPKKERTDHRHHAVDALVIAMTDQKTLQMLAHASERSIIPGKLFNPDEVKLPWNGFFKDADEKIKEIIVSHRVSNKVSGQLHEDTFYGAGPDKDGDGESDFYTITRPLIGSKRVLNKKEVHNIIDHTIRALVEDKLNGGIPEEVFQEEKNLPFIIKPGNKKVFIRKVKIKAKYKPFQLVDGEETRYVVNEANHHVEIFEYTDKNIKKWDSKVVSMMEAYKRKANGEPVIKRDHGEGKTFLFSLARKEVIEIDDEKGNRLLVRIRKIQSDKGIAFARLNDARGETELQKVKGLIMKPNSLRELNCRKVTVDPIGRVRRAND